MSPAPRLPFEVPRIRWHWRWFRWRSALLLTAVALGLGGFMLGVATTERPELVHVGLLAKLYYTFGLFLFGGMDLGTPVGGPWIGRTMLWGAYFLAPMITASAVVEAVLSVLGADTLLLRRLDDHIVVVGCDRLTHLYLRRLREVAPHVSVVVVGSVDESAQFDELRAVYRAQVVEGDPTSNALLSRLRLHRAARVLLLTSDDFINLDAAARILELAPETAHNVIVHVADLRFLRSITATRLAQRCHVFNGHQIGAEHLVQAHLLDHFERTAPRDLVVLAGFGRFGQSVLDELQRSALGAFDRVVIVDLECQQRAAIFGEQVGFASGYRRELVEGDLREPQVWSEVEARIDLSQGAPVFVVGSGNDRTDLRIAMGLARRYPNGLIIARSDRQWSFVEAFCEETGIHAFSVAQLVAESMPQAWFGPRTHDRVGIGTERVLASSSLVAPSLRAVLDAEDAAQ